MEVVSRIYEMRSALRDRRAQGREPVALVPTMGALHEGHAALIRAARCRAGASGTVVVSLFVNPTQFGPSEDLENYPRQPQADAALVEANGGDLVFMPSPGEMYAPDHSLAVDENALSMGLCGHSRPGHFAGVCLVVLKLFMIVQPEAALFGKKDYQQLAVIRRMKRDLNLPLEIVGVETVRERDGLAMSSRNRYLSPLERAVSPQIPTALRVAKARWKDAGGVCTAAALKSSVHKSLRAIPGARVDYVELVHAETLQPLEVATSPALLAIAVYLGKTRLIDNIELIED